MTREADNEHSIPNGFHNSSPTFNNWNQEPENSAHIKSAPLNIEQFDSSISGTNGTPDYVYSLESYLKHLLDGFWDPVSHRFVHPVEGKLLNFTESLNFGLLQENSLVIWLKPNSCINLKKALDFGYIDPKSGNVSIPGSKCSYSLHAAFKAGIIQLQCNKVKEDDVFDFRDKLGAGLFDLITDGSINACTRLLDVQHQQYVTLAVAAKQRLLFNSQTGKVHDSLSNKWLSWTEAAQKEFITNEREMTIADFVYEGSYDDQVDLFKEPSTGEWLNLTEMIAFRYLSPTSQEVINTQTTKVVELGEAIAENLLHCSPGCCYFFDVSSNKKISISEAVNAGFLLSHNISTEAKDLVRRGFSPLKSFKQTYSLDSIQDTDSDSTLESFPFYSDKQELALASSSNILTRRSSTPSLTTKRKASLSGTRRESISSLFSQQCMENNDIPVTLDEAILQGMYNPVSNTITHPLDKSVIPLPKALKEGIIHMESLVRDPVSWDLMALSEAISKRIIDIDSGKMMNSVGQAIALNFAFEKGLITRCRAPLKLSLTEIFDEELYDESSNMFLNPDTNEEITFSDAIYIGLIDTELIRIRDDLGEIFTLESAIIRQIFNVQTASYISQNVEHSFVNALQKGFIIDISSQPGLTLQEAFEEGIYDSNTRTFLDPSSALSCSFTSALESGLLDKDTITVRDPGSQTLLTVDGAIYQNILNANDGSYNAGHKIFPLEEAVRKGLVLQDKGASEISIIEAVKQGIYNAKTHQFMDPKTGSIQGLQDAIQGGMLKPDLTKILHHDKFLTFDEAVAEGILDVAEAEVDTGKEVVDLKIAVDQGFIRLPTHQSSVSLITAIQAGLFDSTFQNVIDPLSGKQLTIQDSIDTGLINPKITLVKRSLNAPYISLEQAIGEDWFNATDGTLNNSEESNIDLPSILNRNLMTDVSFNGMSIIEAVQLKLYDDNSNTVYSPYTGESMSLTNAVNSAVITDEHFIFHGHSHPLTLKQAIEKEILDSSGRFTCEDGKLSITESLKSQFILPSNSLYKSESKDLALTQSDRICMQDYLKEPLVWDAHLKSYINCKAAIRKRILNPDNYTLTLPGGCLLSYKEALETCLLVDAKSPKLGLKPACEHGIFDNQRRMFLDPRTKDYKNLIDSLASNLIDSKKSLVKHPESGLLVTLEEALQKGIISSKTVSVLNKQKKTTIPLEKAVKSGIIFSINDKQLQLADAVSRCLFDEDSHKVLNTLTGQRQTLEQSIESGFISINCTLLATDDSKNLPLSEAVKRNLFDLKVGTVYNPTLKLSLTRAVAERIVFDSPEFRDSELTSMNPISCQEMELVSAEESNTAASIILQPTTNVGIERRRLSLIKNPQNSEEILVTEKSKIVVQDISITSTCSNSDNPKLQESLRSPLILHNSELSELMLPLSLKHSKPDTTLNDFLEKGFYDPTTGHLKDPDRDKSMTILNALKMGLLNPVVDEIVCPQTQESMNILVASSIGLLSLEKGTFKHPVSNTIMNLYDAKKEGWIVKEEGDQIKNILVNSNEDTESVSCPMEQVNTVQFSALNDPAKGHIRLEEAFASGILSRSNSQVIDPDTVQPITLRRAASLGLIDIKTGDFRNPQTGECMTLAEALQRGFIISPSGLTLYSTVDQGLYNVRTGLFIDPSSGKNKDLVAVIEHGLVSTSCTEIRDLNQDSIISLHEAINRGIIDSHEGTYITPGDKKRLNFVEAIAAGLIVSNSAREGLKDKSSSNVDLTDINQSQNDFKNPVDKNPVSSPLSNANFTDNESNISAQPLSPLPESQKNVIDLNKDGENLKFQPGPKMPLPNIVNNPINALDKIEREESVQKNPSHNADTSVHYKDNTAKKSSVSGMEKLEHQAASTEDFAALKAISGSEDLKDTNIAIEQQFLPAKKELVNLTELPEKCQSAVLSDEMQSDPSIMKPDSNEILIEDKDNSVTGESIPSPTKPLENEVFLRQVSSKADVSIRPKSWTQFLDQTSRKVGLALEWSSYGV